MKLGPRDGLHWIRSWNVAVGDLMRLRGGRRENGSRRSRRPVAKGSTFRGVVAVNLVMLTAFRHVTSVATIGTRPGGDTWNADTCPLGLDACSSSAWRM